MKTTNALSQISTLFQLIDGDVINHDDRCFLEDYIPGPENVLFWSKDRIHAILKKILDFRANGRYEKRFLDDLPPWSQETLASLQIALTNTPEPRRSLLFFVMMEIHWSCAYPITSLH